MNYVTYQANERDCGFASLKMLLANLSHNKSYLYLPKPVKKENYTYTDLINLAGENGLSLKAYEDLNKDLSFVERSPALLTLNDSLTYMNHVVYVYKVTPRKVYYNDPLEGQCALPIDKFRDLWDGTYLEVDKASIHSYKAQEKRLIPFMKQLPSFVFHILSMACLLVGFFYVKEDEMVYLPLIFIVAFSVLELVENWYIIRMIQYFDDNYLRDYISNDSGNKKDAYKEYLGFRTIYFNTPRNGLIYLLLIAIIISVLIINNPYNAFPVLFLLLLSILDQFFKKKEDLDQTLAIKEREVLNVEEPDEEFYDNIIELTKEGTKRGFNFSLKRCLYTFLLLVTSVVMMVINNVSSVNFILFNFGIYYVLFDQMRKAVGFKEEETSYKKQKERFLENISINIE